MSGKIGALFGGICVICAIGVFGWIVWYTITFYGKTSDTSSIVLDESFRASLTKMIEKSDRRITLPDPNVFIAPIDPNGEWIVKMDKSDQSFYFGHKVQMNSSDAIPSINTYKMYRVIFEPENTSANNQWNWMYISNGFLSSDVGGK